jgi:hypothetical protein
MITMPGPELLVPGMNVALAAHRDRDLAQREHIVLDSVKVFAYPPSYVRTGPTKAGHYLYWASGCVFVAVDAAGTSALPGDQEVEIIDASLDAWNNAGACSYQTIVNEGRKDGEVGNNKVNLIKFRDTTWGRPAIGDDPARSYAPGAAGLTTATYIDDATSSRDGEILDADVEINGVHFAVSVDGQSAKTGASCLAELQNTLTHELGHLLGIEHPCLASGDPPRVDHLGNPVPQCALVFDPAITEATMFNNTVCGETKKETLGSDDIAAICGIYPISDAPGTCDAVGESGGCCSASDRPVASLFLAGATALLLLRRRRKTSRDA